MLTPPDPPTPKELDLNQIEAGPYRYPTFPPGVRNQIAYLQETFADVWPDSVQGWENDFRRDLHPIKEIDLWLSMAKAYRHFTTKTNVSHSQKREIASLLVACTVQPIEQVVKSLPLRTLSLKRATAVVEYFRRARFNEQQGGSMGHFDFLS